MYKSSCRIIILSASPDEYVSSFATSIGWEGIGSHIDERSGKYVHLHGTGKLEFLMSHFPSDKFEYEYSISDSKSDLVLLRKFREFDLVNDFENL